MSVEPRQISRYGWRPDLPDVRDHPLTLGGHAPTLLPQSVDLREHCPPVYDQGQLGSCTANALGAAYEYDAIRQGEKPVTPSRLFVYFNERVIEGTVAQDAGAMIRDGAKVLASLGAPPETLWPYDVRRFAEKPPDAVYAAGAADVALEYQRVPQTVDAMRACLAARFLFVLGFTVYESFESERVAKTGTVPMPAAGERVLGGHAVLAVGYHDRTQRFIVRNSWGDGWGRAGYFTMPYSYVTNRGLASDFWTIRRVS